MLSSHLELAEMSNEKGYKKRFTFRRTNTNNDPVSVNELPNLDRKDGASPDLHSPMVAGFGDATGVVSDVVRRISEVEANRRLSAFRKDHSYDPNLPDSAFEAVDEATEAHDHKGEADLVGDLVENSPYPEVCCLGPR